MSKESCFTTIDAPIVSVPFTSLDGWPCEVSPVFMHNFAGIRTPSLDPCISAPLDVCSSECWLASQRRRSRKLHDSLMASAFQPHHARRVQRNGCRKSTGSWTDVVNSAKRGFEPRQRFVSRIAAGDGPGDDEKKKAELAKAKREAALRALQDLDAQVDANAKRAVPRVPDGAGIRRAKPQLERELDLKQLESERKSRQERIAQWPSSPGLSAQSSGGGKSTARRLPETRELINLAVALAIMTVITNYLLFTLLHI